MYSTSCGWTALVFEAFASHRLDPNRFPLSFRAAANEAAKAVGMASCGLPTFKVAELSSQEVGVGINHWAKLLTG